MMRLRLAALLGLMLLPLGGCVVAHAPPRYGPAYAGPPPVFVRPAPVYRPHYSHGYGHHHRPHWQHRRW